MVGRWGAGARGVHFLMRFIFSLSLVPSFIASLFLLLSLVAVALSCSRSPDSVTREAIDGAALPSVAGATGSTAIAMAGDSLRGTIEVIFADSVADVSLRTSDGVLVLRGPEGATLRRAAGLDVVVFGRRAPASTAFEVSGFAVRGANGEVAVDGVLDLENGTFFLRTPDGRRVDVPALPVPMRGELGSRIYLAGSLTSGVSAFGVLAERQ